MPENNYIKVCCAIIEEGGKILITQRNENTSNPEKWEFPGGKLEKDETPEECIRREIMEELGISIKIVEILPPVLHEYSDKCICLIPLICNHIPQSVILKEHKNLAWVFPEDLAQYDCSEADYKVGQLYLITKKKP